MSPFAEALRELRFALGMRQQDLAERVGCERTYVSAVENDAKQAPAAAFVDQVCKALRLSDAEAVALHRARERSRRLYFLPPDISSEAYETAYEFYSRLDRLSALQLQGLTAILRLGDGAESSSPPPEGRIRRKDKRPFNGKEDPMP